MEHPPQPENPQQPPLATAVAYPATVAPPPKRRSAVRWLMVLLVLGLCGSLMMNVLLMAVAGIAGLASPDTVQEKYYSHRQRSQNKVAIISLEGTILTGEGFIKRQIDQAKKDENVKAVVLRVNSPGGTITGSDYIYHQLHELAEQRKIPIVVSMGSLAASGGYYVSMACGESGVIFAEPTTWTGSIGVIIPHYNLTGMMTNLGIKEDSIVSHPLKQTGSFVKEMTPQEKKILQALVDEGFAGFKDVIKNGRSRFKEDPASLEKLATGQIYTAKQALSNGLIDEIGFLEEAVAKAIQLARLDEDDVSVVRYKREPNLVDVLMGVRAESRQFDLGTMLEMTAPRAFYLCTWLPTVASSAP